MPGGGMGFIFDPARKANGQAFSGTVILE